MLHILSNAENFSYHRDLDQLHYPHHSHPPRGQLLEGNPQFLISLLQFLTEIKLNTYSKDLTLQIKRTTSDIEVQQENHLHQLAYPGAFPLLSLPFHPICLLFCRLSSSFQHLLLSLDLLLLSWCPQLSIFRIKKPLLPCI